MNASSSTRGTCAGRMSMSVLVAIRVLGISIKMMPRSLVRVMISVRVGRLFRVVHHPASGRVDVVWAVLAAH